MRQLSNKGFTLIELLVTILLLATISTISYISISKIIEKGKDKNCASLVKQIKSAANEYISDNRYTNATIINDLKNGEPLSGQTLADGGYITNDLKNPYSNSNSNSTIDPNSISLIVTINDDGVVSEITVEAPEDLHSCQNK